MYIRPFSIAARRFSSLIDMYNNSLAIPPTIPVHSLEYLQGYTICSSPRSPQVGGLAFHFNSFNFFNFQGSFPLYFDSLFILLGIFSCTKPRLFLRVIVQLTHLRLMSHQYPILVSIYISTLDIQQNIHACLSHDVIFSREQKCQGTSYALALQSNSDLRPRGEPDRAHLIWHGRECIYIPNSLEIQKLTLSQKPMRAEIAKYINEKVHMPIFAFRSASCPLTERIPL